MPAVWDKGYPKRSDHEINDGLNDEHSTNHEHGGFYCPVCGKQNFNDTNGHCERHDPRMLLAIKQREHNPAFDPGLKP